VSPETRRKLNEISFESACRPSFFYLGDNRYDVKDVKYTINCNATAQRPLGEVTMSAFVNNSLLNERVKIKLNDQYYMVKEYGVKLGRPFSTPVLDKDREYWIPFHGRFATKEFCFKESEIKDFNLLIRAWQGFRDAEFEFLLNQGIPELELLLADTDLSELSPLKIAEDKGILAEVSRIRNKYYSICEMCWNLDELKDAHENIMSEHINNVSWIRNKQQERTDLDRLVKAIDKKINNSKSHKCPIPDNEISMLKSYREKAMRRKWVLIDGFRHHIEKIKNDTIMEIRKDLAVNIKAIELLKRWITPDEYIQLLYSYYLTVKSKYYDGYYRLYKEPRTQTGLFSKDGRYIERMCIVCEMGLPAADVLLSKYLMIKFDEEQFIRKADHQYQRYTWEFVRPTKEGEANSTSSRYRRTYTYSLPNRYYDHPPYDPAYPAGARHEERTEESRQTTELTERTEERTEERRQLYIRQPMDSFTWWYYHPFLNGDYKLEYNHNSYFTAHRPIGKPDNDEREIFRGTIYKHLSTDKQLQAAMFFDEKKKPLRIRMYSAPSNDVSDLKCVTIGADGTDQDIIKALIDNQITADQFMTAYKARMLDRTKTAWAGTFAPIFYNETYKTRSRH